MNRSKLLMCAAAIVAAACQDRQSPPAAPSYEIHDAAHDLVNSHFYWLPPMTRQPSFTGTFDGNLSPVVEITELPAGTVCGADGPNGTRIPRPIAMFTTTTGPGSETVRVDPAGQLYIVNWHTRAFNLNVVCTYRIRFLVAGLQLGIADVDVVSSGAQLKRVDTDEFVPLLDDGTLPIKARVEFGAVTFAATGDPTACRPGRDCGEAVVSPGQDAKVLTVQQTAGLFLPAAALREQIVVLIESRTDRPCIPRSSLGVPQFDDCYRYEVSPTQTSIERLSVAQSTSGEINTSYVFGDGNDATQGDNVIVGMCVEVGNLSPAQQALLQIFRFEPSTGNVNALANVSGAFLPCDPNFGTPTPVAASGVLRQGWHLVTRSLWALFGARTAYASTTVIHLGLGGSTCCTSYFTWGLAAVLSPNGPTSFSVSPGATVAPSVIVKDGGGTPMAGAIVTFSVGAGNGTITGTNPVTTGADGIAQVSWQLPSTAGTYTLTASVPAAAGSPISFTATATASALIDFETYPDETPTCASCPLTTEYASRGVVFSFSSTFTTLTNAQLFLSSPSYDPVGGPPNHSVTSAASEGGGFFSGIVRMTFAGLPTSVTFQARGPNSIPLFPVSALNASGGAIASSQISRTNVSTYTPAGVIGPFRQETVTITNAGGIGSVDVVISGFIVLIDNVAITP